MDKTVDILIVDDERINLKLMEGILRDSLLNLVTAKSGEEALKLMAEHDFGVALLDVMMPGMDGFALAEAIRSHDAYRTLPIIFVTAISKEQHHVFRGYELGAVDYLFKPVEPEILRGKVNIFSELHRHKWRLEATKQRLESTIVELEASQVALKESEQRYRMVADYNYDWESWIDPNGQSIYISPSCERITGYPAQRFYDDKTFIERIIHCDDIFLWHSYMSDMTPGVDQAVDFRIYHKSARVRWVSLIKHFIVDESGNSLGIRTNIRDITNRKKMEDMLKRNSLHDPLTGLPNRILFEDRVTQAIQQSSHKSMVFCVLFINIDRFQQINEHYGHAFGDRVLIHAAGLLADKLRTNDTLARFGGDEFIVLLEESPTKTAIRQTVTELMALFKEPMDIENRKMPITVSAGLDMGKAIQVECKELIHNAQLAMLKAKERGKNRYVEYTSKMREGIINSIAIENDLKRGIENGEFQAFYQPIVNLADGTLYGFEALARWIHPDRGLISPGKFIPVAEESGLIVELGTLILEDACTTLRIWEEQHPNMPALMMSVNISAKQFAEPTLLADVKRILKTSGLSPQQLKLEITETVVMGDALEATSRLKALKALGIKLAIDDFGTGYSSMSYLQRFPMDLLKIDLSFVRNMERIPENVEIIRAIVNMAHSLRLQVIAEGIESERQRDLLNSLQCDYGQGYMYSKPVPKETAQTLLFSLS